MANRQIGSVLAACTSATISGSGLRLVISHPDAALYIQPPTLETSVAVHTTAKTGWRNGAVKGNAVPEVLSDVSSGALSELAPAVLLIACSGKSAPIDPMRTLA